ncbi:MAG: RNB domain-containing ribonuclease [Treponema sp.]|nr:RNB domain-containing ribonuclease [Treponema sp.]
MIAEKSLVIYKNKPAIVKERSDGKYTITLTDNTQIKVRDKDIELLHPGPVKDFSSVTDEQARCNSSAVREVWELLSGDEEKTTPVSLKELSVFIFNEYTPCSAYNIFCLLKENIYFTGTTDAILPRSKDEVTSEEIKRSEKQRESDERLQFLQQIKAALKKPLSDDARLPDHLRNKWSGFIQDVEALAYGKSSKSRTMRDLKLGETPEDAHSLLLKTGFWTPMVNPHPARFGLSLNNMDFSSDLANEHSVSTNCNNANCNDPDRIDLCHLEAFAIDSPWSNDPDDAVSIENTGGGKNILYVHVADPASCILFDSSAEKEARDRGVTLYLPEGAVRMLAEDAVPRFALGLSEKSHALTFKVTINEEGEVTETEVFPSVLKARRITYEQADRLIESGAHGEGKALCALYDLSQKIYKRRTANGAVNIELPDIHITIENETVNIEPAADYRSNFIIKECMIAAGEGAGNWAVSKGLAFPYVCQEVELQGKIPSGLAGSIQLRRCMRPRILSAKPGRHQGLGLDTYTQVTSPLRRYTDLLSHIQIHAHLRGDKPIGADDISARLGYSEAASSAAVHAERASVNHWKMVFLACKKDSLWEAVAIENKGARWSVLIPSLALETQVVLQRNASPNDSIRLVLKSVNIPKGEAVFAYAG